MRCYLDDVTNDQLKCGSLLRVETRPAERGRRISIPRKDHEFYEQAVREAAIYRWRICMNEKSGEESFYIGEAASLCPGRIKGYLKPGSSQETNKRMNALFQEYLARGSRMQLEVLEFIRITVDDFVLTPDDLCKKSVRRFLEQLLITYYTQKGYQLLNL